MKFTTRTRSYGNRCDVGRALFGKYTAYSGSVPVPVLAAVPGVASAFAAPPPAAAAAFDAFDARAAAATTAADVAGSHE